MRNEEGVVRKYVKGLLFIIDPMTAEDFSRCCSSWIGASPESFIIVMWNIFLPSCCSGSSLASPFTHGLVGSRSTTPNSLTLYRRVNQ